MDVLWKLLPWNAPLLVVARIPVLIVELWNPLLEPNPRLAKDEDVASVCPELMCPVYPLLPLTVRDVSPNEELPKEDRPNIELPDPSRNPIELLLSEMLDPKRDPVVDELPKCEPSIFETA